MNKTPSRLAVKQNPQKISSQPVLSSGERNNLDSTNPICQTQGSILDLAIFRVIVKILLVNDRLVPLRDRSSQSTWKSFGIWA